MSKIILNLKDPKATLDIAGGKGASLAKLARAGIPVPDGFHITTEAYRQFITENRLQEGIRAALEKVDPGSPPTLEAASESIHNILLDGRVPADVASQIAEAYRRLGDGKESVAVRSSATAEDLPELSFAGQQETYLNVLGTNEVIDAVRRCWASLWTARAIGYRAKHNIAQENVSLAVVVQVLVDAEAAGILFTADPVSGQRDQAVLNATWGLGEAIVGGLVTPDTICIDKRSLKILRKETSEKKIMTVRTKGGTEERAVPAELQNKPVLEDADIAKLAGLGIQIEELYGCPIDIEWAKADGQMTILQARPITALPEAEPPVPTEWKVANPKWKYVRSSVVEFMPDPLTPLFAPMITLAVNRSTHKLMAGLFKNLDWGDSFLMALNGYAYYYFPMDFKNTIQFTYASLSKSKSMMTTAKARWETALVDYQMIVDQWSKTPAGDLQAGEILQATQELLDMGILYYSVLQSGTIMVAQFSEMVFNTFYRLIIRKGGDPQALTFLLGLESKPIRGEKSLHQLAAWCKERPMLAKAIIEIPARQLATLLEENQTPPGIDTADWSQLKERFQQHLEIYGHNLYDMDFSKPVPTEDPAPILGSLKVYLENPERSPFARHEELATKRVDATKAMRSRLGGLKRKWFDKLLAWAQRSVPLREDSLAELGLGWPIIRRLLLELGNRLVGAGALESAEEVFWISGEEAQECSKALDSEQPLGNLAQIIRERKATWRSQKRATPPAMLPDTHFLGFDFKSILPSHEQEGTVIKGAGTSPGSVVAPARVLNGPEDFERMKAGEVLVASITTPAWTPLFALASAVVTDIGGPLSHSSIVAREYGIPAVLGTGVATKRLKDGMLITVDGDAGTVRVQD